MQSCFDMLGELIKFNTEGFKCLNSKLLEKEAENEKDNVIHFLIHPAFLDLEFLSEEGGKKCFFSGFHNF